MTSFTFLLKQAVYAIRAQGLIDSCVSQILHWTAVSVFLFLLLMIGVRWTQLGTTAATTTEKQNRQKWSITYSIQVYNPYLCSENSIEEHVGRVVPDGGSPRRDGLWETVWWCLGIWSGSVSRRFTLQATGDPKQCQHKEIYRFKFCLRLSISLRKE